MSCCDFLKPADEALLFTGDKEPVSKLCQFNFYLLIRIKIFIMSTKLKTWMKGDIQFVELLRDS